MVTVRKSKLLTASSAITENTYYYEFDVDTADELPDPYYNGTIVAHGSKATVINSGEVYRINGDGEWKSQSTSGGASLPDVTAEDNGDVLTVVDGAWDKATPEKELPEVTSSDNGDVLTVVDGNWNKVTPEKELPEVTSSDNGDVLTVVGGVWSKATPNSTKIYTLEPVGGGNWGLADGALMSDVYGDLVNGVNVVIKAISPNIEVEYLHLQTHKISNNVEDDIYYFWCYKYDRATSKFLFLKAEITNTQTNMVNNTVVTVNVP